MNPDERLAFHYLQLVGGGRSVLLFYIVHVIRDFQLFQIKEKKVISKTSAAKA